MYYELALHQKFSENETMTTSIEELATLWQCSSRYAKRAYIYTSEPNTILCMAPNLIQQQVKTLYQPVENLSHIENVLQQMDQQLQQSFCLKFLNHRIHRQYVRQDFSYQNIQFDSNGRIAYKVLFV